MDKHSAFNTKASSKGIVELNKLCRTNVVTQCHDQLYTQKKTELQPMITTLSHWQILLSSSRLGKVEFLDVNHCISTEDDVGFVTK